MVVIATAVYIILAMIEHSTGLDTKFMCIRTATGPIWFKALVSHLLAQDVRRAARHHIVHLSR